MKLDKTFKDFILKYAETSEENDTFLRKERKNNV